MKARKHFSSKLRRLVLVVVVWLLRMVGRRRRFRCNPSHAVRAVAQPASGALSITEAARFHPTYQILRRPRCRRWLAVLQMLRLERGQQSRYHPIRSGLRTYA